MLRFAVRCSMLKYVAVYCNVLQRVAVSCRAIQCVAVHSIWRVRHCSAHCVAACCSALQRVAVHFMVYYKLHTQYVALCCSAQHHVRDDAVHSVLQCVEALQYTVCCSVLQCTAPCVGHCSTQHEGGNNHRNSSFLVSRS